MDGGPVGTCGRLCYSPFTIGFNVADASDLVIGMFITSTLLTIRELIESLASQNGRRAFTIHFRYTFYQLMQILGHHAGDFPVSEQVAAQELSLPMYPEMTDAHIEAVGKAVLAFTLSF